MPIIKLLVLVSFILSGWFAVAQVLKTHGFVHSIGLLVVLVIIGRILSKLILKFVLHQNKKGESQ